MPKEQKSTAYLKLVLKKETNLNYSKILGASKSHKRSSTKLKESKGSLTIEISAMDLAALRASANSILRDMQVIESTNIEGG